MDGARASFAQCKNWTRVLTASLLPALAAAFLMMVPERGTAISGIGMDVGDIRGAGWTAHGVSVSVQLGTKGIEVARVSVDKALLSAELGAMERVGIVCRKPDVAAVLIRCRNAEIAGVLGRLGRQKFTADVSYNRANGALSFAARGLKVAGAAITLDGNWGTSGWRASVESGMLKLADVKTLAAPWFSLPEGIAADGRASVRATVLGGPVAGAPAVKSADVELRVEELTANNAEGTLATDKLGFELTAHLTAAGKDWKIAAKLRAANGQGYSDPVFIDFGKNALAVELGGRWAAASGALIIDSLAFDQTGVAKGRAQGEVAFGDAIAVKTAQVALESLQFPGAYAVLMQPFLLDTALKDFETAGVISGSVSVKDAAPAALDLKIDGMSAKDKGGTLGIDGLKGHVVWSADSSGNPAASELSWSGANAYGLKGGAAQLKFAAAGKDFSVLEPTTIPILDGGLAIETLILRDIGADNMSLRFDATLEPISLPLLCKAFGWPEFSGKISGRIPQVTYDGKVLALGGDLEAQAFGGQVVVNGLRLREPLGKFPRLNANATLRNLDLQAVTGTFSFGEITGRLDGDVNGLELFNWEPVRMQVKLYTPAKDKTRHTISQRAVNNLSNIGGGGGGVGAALQSGFLRFFENFRYQKLGISCMLENDVCRMDGVAPAAGSSYYIVKGSGIPRIDIIGNSRRVDWPTLVGQLKAIQESGGPVVK